MLRTERTRLGASFDLRPKQSSSPREVLLAIAPPPTPELPKGGGWPNWLIPAYRSGGHRPLVTWFQEER